MSFESIEKIADAVLFEGYILYPYRPSSIKNRQRWNFGTLYPHAFAEARNSPEPWSFHAEVLLQGGPETTIDARIRFLQLVAAEGADEFGWDQGFVRSRTCAAIPLRDLCNGIERRFDLSVLSEEERGPMPSSFSAPQCVGLLSMSVECPMESLYRLRVEFSNESAVQGSEHASRKEVQGHAFTSAHLLLQVTDGAFMSALDPQSEFADAASHCVNRGVYPVLAGEQGDRALMLCSPVILYDYPQIAPESAGDFFDGTEMDEMLALRVMTLTDAEQEEMRSSDPHARAILERLKASPSEQLLKVHGAVRGMRPVSGTTAEKIDRAIVPWNPFDETPAIESVRIFGVELHKGDRVRLWPQKKADIMDSAMEGKIALIEAIEQDLEDNIQFAVVLEDDPGRDMGMLRQAGHRFFFSPEEVEPLNEAVR